MQFSGKIDQIIGWRPPFGVSAPSTGKSWIRLPKAAAFLFEGSWPCTPGPSPVHSVVIPYYILLMRYPLIFWYKVLKSVWNCFVPASRKLQGVNYNDLLGLIYTPRFLVARRATYVVDGRFFAHYFWKVEGTVRIHVNSRVAHMWLPYTVINMLGGGELWTSENSESFRKTSIFNKGGGEH